MLELYHSERKAKMLSMWITKNIDKIDYNKKFGG